MFYIFFVRSNVTGPPEGSGWIQVPGEHFFCFNFFHVHQVKKIIKQIMFNF